jgi:hypothetical protein
LDRANRKICQSLANRTRRALINFGDVQVTLPPFIEAANHPQAFQLFYSLQSRHSFRFCSSAKTLYLTLTPHVADCEVVRRTLSIEHIGNCSVIVHGKITRP